MEGRIIPSSVVCLPPSLLCCSACGAKVNFLTVHLFHFEAPRNVTNTLHAFGGGYLVATLMGVCSVAQRPAATSGYLSEMMCSSP